MAGEVQSPRRYVGCRFHCLGRRAQLSSVLLGHCAYVRRGPPSSCPSPALGRRDVTVSGSVISQHLDGLLLSLERRPYSFAAHQSPPVERSACVLGPHQPCVQHPLSPGGREPERGGNPEPWPMLGILFIAWGVALSCHPCCSVIALMPGVDPPSSCPSPALGRRDVTVSGSVMS